MKLHNKKIPEVIIEHISQFRVGYNVTPIKLKI